MRIFYLFVREGRKEKRKKEIHNIHVVFNIIILFLINK